MNIVLVTGANRGIGLTLTQTFVESGDFVFATYRQAENSDALLDLAAQKADLLRCIQADVTIAADRQKITAQIDADQGYLDILINNAGILRPSQSLSDMSAEDFMDSLAVNSMAPVLLIQACLPLLEESAAPKIVNMTMPTKRITSLRRTDMHHYVASRYALNGLTKMIANELGPQGMTTIALYPGYIKTAMSNFSEKAAEPETAIPPLVPLIQRLNQDHNGKCLLPNGKEMAW